MYQPPFGLVVAESPDAVQNRSMKNAKIAHRFFSGWYVGTYKKKTATGKHKGMFEVFYADDKKTYYHELTLDTYRVDKNWVVVSKRGSSG